MESFFALLSCANVCLCFVDKLIYLVFIFWYFLTSNCKFHRPDDRFFVCLVFFCFRCGLCLVSSFVLMYLLRKKKVPAVAYCSTTS
jgi:hypothetical protein